VWARVVECMLGLWLVLSPFILRHGMDDTLFWTVDLAAGTAVVAVALGSFKGALSRLHLVHLLTGTVLFALGWILGGRHPEPAHQNWVIFALLLMMIAVIPSHAHDPPRKWMEFHEEKE